MLPERAEAEANIARGIVQQGHAGRFVAGFSSQLPKLMTHPHLGIFEGIAVLLKS